MRSRLVRRLALVASLYAASCGLLSAPLAAPLTHAFAACVPTPDNQNCPPPQVPQEPITTTNEFNVTIPTPDTTQAYHAVYSLTPVGPTHGVGTVQFYLGPASTNAAGALEAALLNAPSILKQDIQREIDIYANPLGVSTTDVTASSPTTSTQIAGASPQCGNSICQRYEEMKYCWDGSTTQTGDGGCNAAWRTVDGVFSYDNNGAYASDNGDFTDCSQNREYSNGTGGYYTITPTWCGNWNQGPWSDTTHSYMDYGMNADVSGGTGYQGQQGDQWSIWIRMDDYAGCGSIGNRGGASE